MGKGDPYIALSLLTEGRAGRYDNAGLFHKLHNKIIGAFEFLRYPCPHEHTSGTELNGKSGLAEFLAENLSAASVFLPVLLNVVHRAVESRYGSVLYGKENTVVYLGTELFELGNYFAVSKAEGNSLTETDMDKYNSSSSTKVYQDDDDDDEDDDEDNIGEYI